MTAPLAMPLTRRQLVTGAGTAPPPSERQLLSGLIALEQLAVAVYELALGAGFASPSQTLVLETVHAQESAHAAAVARLRGLPLGRRPAGAPAIQASLTTAGITLKLSAIRTARDWFTLLETLESVLEGAYYTALADLTQSDAAALAASILASEAQHATLLFRDRHPRDAYAQVPSGLVQGTPPPARTSA